MYRENSFLKSIGIFIIGIIISIIITYYFKIENDQFLRQKLEINSNDIKDRIENRLNAYIQFSRASSAFVMSSDTITRDDWRSFVDKSRIAEDLKGFQGVAFILNIPDYRLEEHEKRFQNELENSYSVFPEGLEKIKTPIIYIEPFKDRNLKALGFNISSNPLMKNAIEKARDLNEVILTDKVTLIQEGNGHTQPGIVIYSPIYYKSLPINTIQNRKEAINGWAAISFRMNDFMEGVIGNLDAEISNHINLNIFDKDSISTESLLYNSEKNLSLITDKSNSNTLFLTIELNEKKWTLQFFQQKNSFLESINFLALLIGITISFLLSFIIFTLLNTISIAKKIANNLTLNLSEKNEELVLTNNLLKESYTEIKIAKEKAEESNNLKNEFLNNMSHEIRTPLNGILGFTEFLNNPNLSEEKKKNFIKIIQSSGQQLMQIIDDIIDISILGTKQIKVIESKVCLNDLMMELFSIFDIKAKENKTPLYLKNGLSDFKSTIITDKTKLNKVISNLLENSLKFTNEGSIEFGYQLKNNELEIYVKDTGIGIDSKKHELIFERFVQAEKELSKKTGGLGLGLSIVKENVELIGGKIRLESEKGKGSTFLITIPYKPVYSIDEKIDKSKKIILIAEDEEVNYLYLESLLNEIEKLDCQIIHAKNGQEAIDMCKINPTIDLVLMDVKMPLVNGYEATAKIRAFNKKLPIVALTAYTGNEEREKSILAGCDDFISKPINLQTFNSLIDKYLKNSI